ncbi:MAG: hypothetical protein ABI240_05170, partial [Sphingomonas sp.]
GGTWIGVVPVLSILLTLVMVGPVLGDLIYKALRGDWIPAAILVCYILTGAVFYALYSVRYSRLGIEWRRQKAADLSN